ncbi:DUF2142 domain-containing protein [Enorma massiliensis]|uniref:DUF2142 domain-containing protein n=1 Tax=Enorma massiliensis TaxID=1472761 RepID=UPI003A8EE426
METIVKSRRFSISVALAALLFLALDVTVFCHFTTEFKYLLLLYGVSYVAWLSYLVCRAYRFCDEDCSYQLTRRRLAFIAVTACGLGILLTLLTAVGSHNFVGNVVSRAAVVRLFCFTLVSFLLITVFEEVFCIRFDLALGCFCSSFTVKAKQLACLIGSKLVFIATLCLVDCVIAFVISMVFSLSFPLVSVFLFMVSALCALLVFVWIGHKVQVEYLFASVALCFGLLIIFGLPAESVHVWDDQVHYARALSLSYVVDTEVSNSDARIMFAQEDNSIGHAFQGELASQGRTWHQDAINEYHTRLDGSNSAAVVSTMSGLDVPTGGSLASISTISYTPAAIGLWLGRLLHLPFSIQFRLGEIGNLLCYVIVIFNAIRIIPSKKVLVACVGLFPTSLLMASGYSYDPWIIAFLILAISLFLREASNRQEPLETRTAIGLYALFFIALAPKPTYFPLIGILFLMPRAKFPSKEKLRLYYSGVVTLGLVVVLAFALPFVLSSGASATDTRGGADVNGGAQIAYILANPIEFAVMLCSFLANSYLTVPVTNSYILNMGYLNGIAGVEGIAGLPIICIMLVAIFDTDGHSDKRMPIASRVWVLFTCSVAIMLAALALYISYTPVAASFVAGLQPRYLLPVVLPVFLAVFYQLPLFAPKYKQCRFQVASFGFSTLLLGAAVWVGVIGAVVV